MITAEQKLTGLAEIWRDSAKRNRDSAVYWLKTAQGLKATWPEMFVFAVQRYDECNADAERDERMADSLEASI